MAKKRVGKFPKAFRQYAVERLKQCENIVALAKELGVHRRLLYTVARSARAGRERRRATTGEFARDDPAQRGQPTQASVGGEDAGGGFFQRCLAKSRGSTPAERQLWRDGIYDQIRDVMSQQGSLSIERMCQLAPVSRAGFYRSLQESQPVEEEMAVRAEIQQIALEHRRRYGYRRITAELRRRGLLVNHKRVARLMREDNLLAVQPRAFVVTTDAQHELEVYLNLASRLTLTGINQLWVADITYIRLRAEFVYLAVILDGFSRKVVGWALDTTLATRLPTERVAPSDRRASAAARRGASFGSRRPVCLWGLRAAAPTAPDDPEHEPAGEPVRQRQLRELHEDAQAGGDLRQHRIGISSTCARTWRPSSSSTTIALGFIRRSAIVRRRSSSTRWHQGSRGAATMQFFRPAEGSRSEEVSEGAERATRKTQVC